MDYVAATVGNGSAAATESGSAAASGSGTLAARTGNADIKAVVEE